MNVLFYVEPLTERGSPTAKRAWLIFVSRMAKSIRQELVDAKFLFVISDSLADEPIAYKNEGVALVRQADLVPRFGRSTLDVSSHWYQGGTERSLQDMATLVMQRVDPFQPDICITFSPAPFLQIAFPSAAVLHFEHGLVSRPPFPMTAFLDPFGMVKSGYPALHSESVKKYVPHVSETDFTDHLRTEYTKFFSSVNPLSNKLRSLRDSYAKVVLVSLQVPGFFAFDCHADFPDQFDLVLQVLENVSADTAVIVSEHPQCFVLTRDALAYFQKKYPNFVWIPEIRELSSPSFFLMEYVDLVVAVSSTVGLQSLIWQKNLVVAGDSNLNSIADSNCISDLSSLLSSDWSAHKTNVLTWHLTRYAMPFEILFEKGLIVERIKMAMAEKKNNGSSYFDVAFADVDAIGIEYNSSLLRAQIAALANLGVVVTTHEEALQDSYRWTRELNEILREKNGSIQLSAM